MYLEYVRGEKYPPKAKDQVISDDINDFYDAGYILEDDDLVIDIDKLERNQIEQLIETFDIKTQIEWTDRGVHLYYKRPTGRIRSHSGIVPLGFPVELFYKKGNQKYTSVCCKRNGVKREVINEGVREELPDIFKIGNYPEFLGMQEGDQRNNTLYKLKKKIMKFTDWRKMLRFINDCILAEPLSAEEFENMARDENLTAENDSEYDLAQYLMKKLDAVVYQKRLFVRGEDSKFTCDDDSIQRIVYRYAQGRKSTYVEEVIKQMRMRADIVPPETEFKVSFNNGYLFDGQFYPIEFEGFTPYVLDVSYDENAKPVKEVDDYLDQLSDGDPNYRNRIIEIISHCLVVNKEFKRMLAKFHVIRGGGGNGKGTFLQVIKHILGGTKNCSALSISQMSDERYVYNMVGKLANLGDDLTSRPINDDQMKMIKNLTTCDPVEVRRMRENSTTEEFVITLIFTSNHVIKSFEKSEAYKRRVDWLPIFTKPKKKDPQFISKITTPDAINYWIRLAVEGYKRLYEQGGFTDSKVIEEFNQEYHEENDNTLVFLKGCTYGEIEGKRPPEVYNMYLQWCEENGEDSLKKKTLNEGIQRTFGLKSNVVYDKDTGKAKRVYEKPSTKHKKRLVG